MNKILITLDEKEKLSYKEKTSYYTVLSLSLNLTIVMIATGLNWTLLIKIGWNNSNFLLPIRKCTKKNYVNF